jgi:sec-independent protein translocase protein TatC
MGVLFSYYIVTPFSVIFLSQFKIAANVQNQWKIGEVIDLITQIVLGGAIVFELPIVVYYLSKLGVLSPAFMRAYHRHAIVLMFVLAAVITPPDVLSMLLTVIPLVILYEISIFICVVVTKNQAKEAAIEE